MDSTSAEETAAWLAAIVDSSDDAIVSKTLDGIITSWNRSAERMFGYSAGEAIGQHITLIIPPELRTEEDEVIARLRRGEKVEHFDTIRVTKDGRRLNISLTISPVRNLAGTVIGASKIARDITDRKRVEAERTALLAEAEAANRAKDEFLAMFGHELRNPLAAIASAAEVLRLIDGTADMARPVAVIDRQIGHLRRLVDDLLDAARIRAGKIKLERRPVNLAEAVEHALGVLRAGSTPARHVIDVDAEDVGVDADPTRLEQILLNLLTNAVKYTPAGRSIRVAVSAQHEHAVVTVADEGVGISAEALPRIFDLFVQGERSLDRARGGLGIGLTLVRALTELHGGSIQASSRGVGLGSVFTLRLPRIALAHAAAGSAARRARTSRRVLIVEDNDDARDMLKLYLERQGHEVFEAADGAEGVEVALRREPELAFIDLGLPVLDGFEVARHLRLQPHPPARLIALTGYGQPEDRQRCLQAGFDEHLVKPVDPVRLAEIMEAAG